MPRYDIAKVTQALQMVKDGVPYDTIATQTGLGRSTLDRHVQAYREGQRADIDVGELPPPRSTPNRGSRGNASLVRVTQRLSATTHAQRLASDAASMEAEAGRLEGEASRLRTEAGDLKRAAKLLEKAAAPKDGVDA